jgi:fido (protein-threonine AMPylation protein)
VLRILDFGGLPVFENAKDTYVCIPLIAKAKQLARVEVARIPSLDISDLDTYANTNHFTIPHQRLSAEAWALKSDEESAVFEKLMKVGKPLGEYVERKFFRGLLTGLNKAFELIESQRIAIVQGHSASEGLIKPFLGGQDIRRYQIENEKRFLIVIPSGWTQVEMGAKKNGVQSSESEAWRWFSREHSKIAQHLEPFAVACRERQDQGEYWWELRACDYYKYFDQPKIIFADICKEPRFFLDRNGIYLANTAYLLGVDDTYLLGVLNSKLFWFAISNISIPFGIRAGKYRYRLIYQYMEKIPIRVINFSDKSDTSKHDKMVSLVERMSDLHKRLAMAKVPDVKSKLQRQIETIDREIDCLVYDLYGLTEEEIRIVEGTAVASGAPACENRHYEDTEPSSNKPRRCEQQAASVAKEARNAGEGGGGSSESDSGTRRPVDGVRERTGEYGSPEDPPEESEESAEQLGSTRYFETAEGTLSYTQVSERLAVAQVGVLDEILQTVPEQIIITPEWLCLRHQALAGRLFPEWAGRFRDINVQVGFHTPPPFYEVPVLTRLFCDDLAERLSYIRPLESYVTEIAELLAWADGRFQWIHPFKDFNGRVGRVLLAAILYKLVLPHVETAPMEPLAKRRYLDALHAADNGDLGPLTELWMRRIVEQL